MFQQNKKKSNKNEHLANKGKLKNSIQKKLYQEVNQAAILNMICTTKSEKSKLWQNRISQTS